MAPDPMILSHRGAWWPNKAAQNSLDALAAAFAAGHGVEVDVRQREDQLVLAHDLPVLESDRDVLPSWQAFLDLAWETDPNLPILVDLKEPGTEGQIAWDIQAWGLTARAWLFDFELCGADPHKVKAAAPEVRLLRRASDRAESDLGWSGPFPGIASGFWLDQWDSDWITAEDVQRFRAFGPVFVVAPDLHGRLLDFRLLERWREADGICTDMGSLVGPWLARQTDLFPKNIWWGE